MKFCPNCGNQLSEGVRFCTYCGTPISGGSTTNVSQPQPSAQQYNNNQGNGMAPKVNERNIVVAILLSMITCGIYGIIWYINMVDDVNSICDEKGPSGGTVFLYTIITCGIYGIIWEYKAGQRLYRAGQQYNMGTQDNSTMYLVLAIIGLQIVNYCLIQSELNRYAQ